jgi:ubiquinone biosynthesis protein
VSAPANGAAREPTFGKVSRWRVLRRLVQIQRITAEYGLQEFLAGSRLERRLAWLRVVSPWTWFVPRHSGSRGERLRLALETLGPIFIKFGQALSTRRDLLPADLADELAKLQDRVPPFPVDEARQRIEAALGAPVGELFAEFETEPLGAASLAQVHGAVLKTGEAVVVKVLRPGMRERIVQDLELMYAVAGIVATGSDDGRRLRPVEVVSEYEKTVLDELDLMREAGNAAQLRRQFLGSPIIHVPAVYWDLCRVDVMVMERVHGVQISDIAKLRELGTDFKKLGEYGVEIFFTQVFKHNFFHADMHPGNIFVDVTDPQNPRYAAIDFGIVGTLDTRDQHYLAANFLAFFDRDYRRVAQLHVDSGWVPPDTRIDELESAVRTVCEPIFNKPLSEISFGQVLLRLFETARRFRMEVQPQLILLQKTLLNIEGLGRQLYPELDLWQTAQPILRQWMKEHLSPLAVLRSWRQQAPDVLEALKGAPAVLQRGLHDLHQGKLTLQLEPQRLAALQAANELAARRRDATVVACAGFLGGVLWCGLAAEPVWAGWVAMAASALYLLLRRR